MVTISAIAYAVRTASEATSHPLKLSHAQQLVAAALGYRSLAAYQASPGEAEALNDAAHFVLDDQLLVARAQELRLPNVVDGLTSLLHTAFEERLPSAQIHASSAALDAYVRDIVQEVVLTHGNTASATAMTNSNGIREIYLPFDDVVLHDLPLGEVLREDFVGHVSMEVDTERPYHGHKIDVEARLVLERKGRACIAEPICEVVSAKLNYGWNAEDEDDVPTVSLAQALADELGLELAEAEELVDAEAMADESDDGLLYRYIYDFRDHASPTVAEKLIAKYGSLEVEVPAWFFDRVSPLEYI